MVSNRKYGEPRRGWRYSGREKALYILQIIPCLGSLAKFLVFGGYEERGLASPRKVTSKKRDTKKTFIVKNTRFTYLHNYITDF